MSGIFYRCVILLLLLASAAAAQTKPAAGTEATLNSEATGRLQTQAEECGRAFVEGDFERLAFYTYPKVVEMMGGPEKMASLVRKGVEEMKAEGLETLSYTTAPPTQVLRAGRQTYAVVPATLRVRVPKGVLVSETFMIAVSADGGRNWKFVSGSSADPAKLKVLFPAAAGRLRMPPHKTPTLEPAP